MKKRRNKIRLSIILISPIVTYFVYTFCRALAVSERGSSFAFGGEVLTLLIPVIAWIVYENILLSTQVRKETKGKDIDHCSNANNGRGILHITEINNIETLKQ